ncbi:MAG: hypothetical protein IKD16_05615 [Bacteroidales bacterium]|nr:hypothetical protein [Bacteroidales bacterium]
MTRLILFITALLLSTSCSFFENVSKGERVAEIGNAVLYKSDLDKVMPRNATSQDSAAFIAQYIDSWALRQLLVMKAEEQLPKNEKDVAALLEEYRIQLLVFRYENKYIEERLDTLITESEKREYYNLHKASFITENGVIKGRFIKMHNSSPSLQIIKGLLAKRGQDEMTELEQLAYDAAYKYDDYGNNWVDLSIVARDMDMDISNLWIALSRKSVVEQKDTVYSKFLQVLEFVEPGGNSPYEYNADKIDDIILSKRKQELISRLHKDIMDDAFAGNRIKIIENENN